MSKQDSINHIRRQYLRLDDLPRKSLRGSLKTLAEDLYAKNDHFIFELIQNADDNHYDPHVRPNLSFEICHATVEGQCCLAMIVRNNELGFNYDNVIAICSAHDSTKAKNREYIGEKGIGFKSVFLVTACPYVFSAGFNFCLPEKDDESGLGYIVPRWVSEMPAAVASNETTIVLPLKVDENNIRSVIEGLQSITPESLFFLNKLNSIEISIDLPDHNINYKVTLEKHEIKKIGNSKLVQLTCKRGGSSSSESPEVFQYWLTDQVFKKPDRIQNEKRDGIESRIVSVAIPLGQEVRGEKLFAYLPVWDKTGLPFIINADFLLASAREEIKVQEEWNKWLRDCIPDAYVQAFSSLLNAPEVGFETKLFAYRSIPQKTHNTFLEPIIDPIQKRLSELDCVFVLPGKHLVRPEHARLTDKNFQNILLSGESLPTLLQKEESMVVCPEIELYSVGLRKISVKQLSKSEILYCLKDTVWVQSHTLQWFIDLFIYLKNHHSNEERELESINIVPIEDKLNPARVSCNQEQPIYLAAEPSELDIFPSAPQWLLEFVPIAFIKSEFMCLIEQHRDHISLKKWLSEALSIGPFLVRSHCLDVSNKLSCDYRQLEPEFIMEAETFLAQHHGNECNWPYLPVVLSDGRKCLLKDACAADKQSVVVPSNYDVENGWQHIWRGQNDRPHFCCLSPDYDGHRHIIECLLKKGVIAKYPMPKKHVITERPQTVTKVTEDYLPPDDIPSNVEVLVQWIYYYASEKTNWPTLTTKNDFSGQKSDIKWACKKIYYEQHGTTYKVKTGHYQFECEESSFLKWLRSKEWVPTSKGPQKPSNVFLPKQGIKEILGDDVPYFEGNLPEAVLHLLQIRTEITVEILIDLLSDYSGYLRTDPDKAGKLYQELSVRTICNAQTVRKAFFDKTLIFARDSKDNYKWFSSSECIWEDAAGAVDLEFCFLENQYPALKDFFVTRLGVNERVDTECFAQRWLKLQDAPLDKEQQRSLLERLYQEIKPVAKKPEHERPDWWGDFAAKARLYTTSDEYADPDEIVVPDDGEYRDIFQGCAQFAWKPGKDSWSEWLPLYEAFEVCLISEKVTHSLNENVDYRLTPENKYVTTEAVKLIAAWLREKLPAEYDRIFKSKKISQLFTLKEAIATDTISIDFELETDRIYESETRKYPVFWDPDDNNILLYQPHVKKSQLAKCLAKGLVRNYKDLSHWIELVLESQDTERLKDESWNVPQEVLDLCRIVPATEPVEHPVEHQILEGPSSSAETDSEKAGLDSPELAGGALIASQPDAKDRCEDAVATSQHSDTGDRLQKIQRDGILKGREEAFPPRVPMPLKENDPIEIREEFRRAFNRGGTMQFSEEFTSRELISSYVEVNDPARRSNKVKARYLDGFNDEPSAAERRKETERTILEGPNEKVRASLYKWYQGKCQICNDTWPKGNGDPFFTAAYIIERHLKRYVDEPFNALCLCAEHFAQWRHAAKVARPDVIDQILALRLKQEGGDGNLSVHFEMFQKDHTLTFVEEHLHDLRTFLESSESQGDQLHEGAQAILPSQITPSPIPEIEIRPVQLPDKAPDKQITDAPVVIRRSPYKVTLTSVTDPKVCKVISSMTRLQSNDHQSVISKAKELVIRFLSHEEYKKVLREEGIHLSSVKMALDYLVPQFDHTKLGYSKFTDLLKQACAGTNAEIFLKPPAEMRLGLRNGKPVGFRSL